MSSGILSYKDTSGESPLSFSKYSHTAMRIQPLSEKSYTLPSRGGGVVYENERTKANVRRFNRISNQWCTWAPLSRRRQRWPRLA
ncbi:unnamed protein product [Schistosoma margrebowiei]|uniref:Uncharacterized protein n=1 Tax=Schistosoma margrebowiei TaxID=48269 RepID=A0A183MLX3_9TREM|nr:unnamed protein product [Schistosoma margrebowiei]